MGVKLIWITPDAEAVIAHCARVSNPKNQGADYKKLLDYCRRKNHNSIFEMASACIEIETTRTIARQILRHRSFSFQEFSGRYSEMPESPILTAARRQDLKNRQNSIDDMEDFDKEVWRTSQAEIWEVAWAAYQLALENGVAKELARNVLPEGLTASTMYMSGTIRSWIHYLDVRCGEETQKEHRDLALGIKGLLQPHLPNILC